MLSIFAIGEPRACRNSTDLPSLESHLSDFLFFCFVLRFESGIIARLHSYFVSVRFQAFEVYASLRET